MLHIISHFVHTFLRRQIIKMITIKLAVATRSKNMKQKLYQQRQTKLFLLTKTLFFLNYIINYV